MAHGKYWLRLLLKINFGSIMLNSIFRVLPFVYLLITIPVQAGDLEQLFAGVNSIETEFKQIMLLGKGKDQESSGVLYILSPNQFRLEYRQPYRQLYVADGNKLWSYDEDLEQVIVKQQGQVLASTPAMVLSNPQSLEQNYLVEEQGAWEGQTWYKLTPKIPDSNFEFIRLSFKNKKIATMELKDSFGQFNRLIFQRVRYNVSFPSGIFSFTPPEGVDVITE